MSVLSRAGDVPPSSRTDYWQHVVDTTLGPLQVQQPPEGIDARDQLLLGDAGAPASTSRTSVPGSSLSRAASTQPALPAPTIT